MMLAALLYTVQLLSLPPNDVVVTGPTPTQALMEPVLFRRPSTIALSSSGIAAFVVGKSEGHAADNMEHIVIDDAKMHVLPLPGVGALAPFFLSPRAANLISVRNLVISRKGKPVVGLSMDISGAYGATQEASFTRVGSRWIPALRDSSGAMPKNVWVAAADSRGGLGYVGDYLDLDPASLVNARGDNLFNVAMTRIAQRAMVLGSGIITGMSGNRTVGYDDGYVPGSNGSTPVRAIKWTGYYRSVLGTGIAWSVNAQGDVVGDNRKTLKSVGVPMLWHNDKPIRLSDAEGTAFAVADDGTIVGDVKSRAFLIRPNDASHRLIFLDDLVAGGWNITAAYYVASNGDILALASKRRTLSRLVLLRPVRQQRVPPRLRP